MRISSDRRIKINSAHERALLAEARAAEASISYVVLVRETLIKLGAPINDSAICLKCGSVNPINVECLECDKESVNEISEADSEL